MILKSLLIISLLIWAAAGFASLFFVYPWAMRSIFRYRLWQLRDDVHRDLRHGNLPATSGRLFLRHIETQILGSKRCTVFKLLIAGWVMPDIRKPVERPNFSNHKMKEYQAKLDHIVISHLIKGSPFGWLFFIVLLPKTFLKACVQLRKERHRTRRRKTFGRSADRGLHDLAREVARTPAVQHLKIAACSAPSPLIEPDRLTRASKLAELSS
jgi:hypothetical protein